MSSPSLADFYRGKSVLLTGGTGFVGKVLLEKLLRAYPDIGTIYLLLRTGSDRQSGHLSVDDRLRHLLQSPPFTLSLSPLAIEKVLPIEGDLNEPGLGLSPSDRRLLQENVSVVFHCAATVKFDGPVREFIKQNVLATEAIMQLATEMSNLQSVVYVSTAYSNCNLAEIEEKVYPLRAKNQVTVDVPVFPLIERLMKEKSDQTLLAGDVDLLGRPNAYTLSKAIAENLVKQKYAHLLPVVICRPSIVTASVSEPAKGWVDSLNGFAGTFLLTAMGIMRTMEVECNLKADLIPVDYVANSLIVIGWHTATHTSQKRLVVNLTSGSANPITWGQVLDDCRLAALKWPSSKLVRPLAGKPTSARGSVLGKTRHLCTKFFSHLLFAYLFDCFLFLSGQKRLLVKVTEKMHRAQQVLAHFTNNEWSFRYDNYREIFEKLSPLERETFRSIVDTVDWKKYFEGVQLGSRRYLLKEEDSTLGYARKRQEKLTFYYEAIKAGLKLTFAGLLAFLLFRLTFAFSPNMANTFERASSQAEYLLTESWNLNGDPRNADYPLMSTFKIPLAAFILYHAFVHYLGPRLMANRAPFSLKWAIIPYNLLMSLANLVFFCKLFRMVNYGSDLLDVSFKSTDDIRPSTQTDVTICYLYLLSKYIDKLDTVFFILRKKDCQLTGLHVYHHSMVPLMGWAYFRINSFHVVSHTFAVLNSPVHTLMYAYYGLAAFGPQMQPYLWWKRYITQIQIVQFVLLFSYGVYFTLFQTGYSPYWAMDCLIQTALYLLLFTRFYIKSYRTQRSLPTKGSLKSN